MSAILRSIAALWYRPHISVQFGRTSQSSLLAIGHAAFGELRVGAAQRSVARLDVRRVQRARRGPHAVRGLDVREGREGREDGARRVAASAGSCKKAF